MKLTQEQYAILDYVLVNEDPQAYVDRALANDKFTEDHILQKINRWRAPYEAAIAKPGYKTGRERLAEEKQEKINERVKNREKRKAAAKEEEDRIRNIVKQELAKQ